MSSAAVAEAARGERFEFGKNWQRYIRSLTPEQVDAAEQSLRSMLDVESLRDRTFLDIGSGSGLFSLAAHRMGARVYSFDYDPFSVACTDELRKRYSLATKDDWTVSSGSALDEAYLASLPKFDVVYSWGVLHHTGSMWRAIDNAASRVTPGGRLFIALYNDEGGTSRRWAGVKKLYVSSPRAVRPLMAAGCFAWVYWKPVLRAALHGHPLRPFRDNVRGMTAWRDTVDWVGGYPFEVSKPGEVFEFLHERGFDLTRMTTTNGSGCNEFVFQKKS